MGQFTTQLIRYVSQYMTQDPIHIMILCFSGQMMPDKVFLNVFLYFDVVFHLNITDFTNYFCLVGASYTILSVINGYAKALPYHWLSSNWLCKRNLTVISHFNKVCFGFHWYRLKCLTCCVQIILEWALSVSSFNGYVYRSIYRQIECLDISFVIIS